LLRFAYSNNAQRQPHYRLIYTHGQLPTCSFFRLLFWDNSQELSADKQAFILRHELTHIRQWHSADALLLELLKVVCWFNPVVYLLKRSLEEVHEYLADASVVRQYDARQYSQVMAEQTLNTMNFAFTQSFNRSLINKRMAMIQINKLPRPAFWKMALSLPLVAVLFFIYACRTAEVIPAKTAQATNAGMYRMGEVVVVGYGPSPGPVLKDANEKFSKYNLPVPLHKMEEGVYEHVDEVPAPMNGMANFQQAIQKTLFSSSADIRGTVYVQAIVDVAGNILNPVVLHGISPEFDAQVLKAIEKGPKWNPGKINGNPVSIRLVIPVQFGKNPTPYTSLFEIKELSKESAVGKPVPQEGMEAFYKHIQKYLKYPSEARSNLIGGQVVVSFTVQKDGTLANLEVVESVFPALDAEVIRVIGESKLLWKPAMENGQVRESRIVLPVKFILG
jgi:TonB family protein